MRNRHTTYRYMNTAVKWVIASFHSHLLVVVFRCLSLTLSFSHYRLHSSFFVCRPLLLWGLFDLAFQFYAQKWSRHIVQSKTCRLCRWCWYLHKTYTIFTTLVKNVPLIVFLLLFQSRQTHTNNLAKYLRARMRFKVSVRFNESHFFSFVRPLCIIVPSCHFLSVSSGMHFLWCCC